jgi:hypothetical protein
VDTQADLAVPAAGPRGRRAVAAGGACGLAASAVADLAVAEVDSAAVAGLVAADFAVSLRGTSIAESDGIAGLEECVCRR